MFRAKERTIDTPAPQPAPADGKPAGQTPVSFSTVPGALEVFA
jgi:diacylglycerol kinase family enzyme